MDPDVEAIECIVLEEHEEPVRVQKRVFNVRPLNWRVIAEHFGQWGKHKTIRVFSNESEHRTARSIDQALKQWLEDFRSQRLVVGVRKAPAYGNDSFSTGKSKRPNGDWLASRRCYLALFSVDSPERE